VTRPLEGTIVAYSLTDGVGRIQLDDGEELRFSVRAMQGIVPAVGLRVTIGATEPYPLGGRRALQIGLAEDKRSYERRRREFEAAQGEVMRNELGRRAEEYGLPVESVASALGAALPPPAGGARATSRAVVPRAATARPRASSPRPATPRAATARPATPRAATARAATARPAGRAATVPRGSSSRATTARPSGRAASAPRGSSSRATTARPSGRAASSPRGSSRRKSGKRRADSGS